MFRIRLALMGGAAALLMTACSTTASTTSTPPPTTPAAAAPTTSAAAASTSPAATALSGKWTGMYSGAYQGTFVLNWQQTGSNLAGHIMLSNPANTLRITGSVNGSTITFGTVGSTAITYTGSLSGSSSMSGNYQVHAASGASGGPWSATKS